MANCDRKEPPVEAVKSPKPAPQKKANQSPKAGNTSKKHPAGGQAQSETLSHFPETYSVVQKSLIWRFPKHLGNYTIYGNSWACHQTAFQIPELGWTLDCGFIPHPQRRTHLFLTHAHGDHSTSLPFVISRHCPPEIYLPETTVESCRSYLESHLGFRLHGQEIESFLPTFALHGVAAGSKYRLNGKVHSDKIVEVFSVYHSVTCVGYGFSQEKKKLKAEFQGLPGAKLGQLRKEGTVIDQNYESPMFAFMGDTTAQFYREHVELEKEGKENIFRYPLIITECTFLGDHDEDAQRAEQTKHTFWPELKPIVEAHPQVTFLLIHFSLRYSETEVRAFFKKENLPNVVAFVEQDGASPVFQSNSDLAQ